MKLKVTEEGVLIPKELLGDSQEVEVIQSASKIIITTTQANFVEPISNFDPSSEERGIATIGIILHGHQNGYELNIPQHKLYPHS